MRGSTRQRLLWEVQPLPENAPRALLVVGDDLYRVGLATLLRDAGVDVIAHVATVRGAVELARELEPDIVVLELGDSRGAALPIARLRGLARPPSVLALSPAPNRGEALEALGAGASGYADKADDAERIGATVHALHAGDIVMPASAGDVVLAPLREAREPARASALAEEPLTEREVQVVSLVAQGLANEEIARELVVTASTVKNHVTRIVTKLGARNRTHAAVLAAHRRYI